MTLHPKETQQMKRRKRRKAEPEPKRHNLLALFFVALLKVQRGRQTHSAAVFAENDKNNIKRQKFVEFHKTTTILYLGVLGINNILYVDKLLDRCRLQMVYFTFHFEMCNFCRLCCLPFSLVPSPATN